jgi:hypothetical protein
VALANALQYQPNQQYLFNRSWSVAVSPPGQSAAKSYSQLRVQFDIDKLGLGTSSKAKITVFNLSQQSRQTITKGWNVQLKAGYGNGALLATIFLGVIGYNGAYSKRDGADILTSFECGDGEAALVLGTLDKSYPAGSTVVQILQDITVQSGLGVGTVTGIPNVVFNKGYTAHGSITQLLNELTKKCGLAWNVNNGNINIIPVKGYNGLTAITMSANTGLIGVPSMDNGVLKFDSLLNPLVVPGGLVNLVSENTVLNGVYKLNRTHIEGDSHDSKWQIACEAVKFPNAQATTPVATGTNFSTAVD